MSEVRVRVLAFGHYAEVLGAESLEVTARPGMTVRDALEMVRERPGGKLLPAHILCALNLRQAEPADLVREGDELALLPPLAGG